jgi:hypothetical protein
MNVEPEELYKDINAGTFNKTPTPQMDGTLTTNDVKNTKNIYQASSHKK